MKRFYQFMDEFYATKNKTYGYEIALNRFLQIEKSNLNYVTTEGNSWININYEEDYFEAKTKTHQAIYGLT